MPDDKKKQGFRDDNLIDPSDPNELAYAAKEFGVTSAEIVVAIKEVGNSRKKVGEFLNKGRNN